MKAKAAAANVASKQNIASDFGTPSPTAKGSVYVQQSLKTISRGDLPTFLTRGVDYGPGQESTWAAEAGISSPKDRFVLKIPLVFYCDPVFNVFRFQCKVCKNFYTHFPMRCLMVHWHCEYDDVWKWEVPAELVQSAKSTLAEY